MGQSTDALLFYGFLLKEEDVPWGDEDPERWLVKQLGLGSPSEQDPGYWARKRQALADLACTIETHCSGEYPMFAVIIKGTRSAAHRGDPVRFSPANLTIDPQWDAQLRAFATTFNLPFEEPSWLLASYWG